MHLLEITAYEENPSGVSPIRLRINRGLGQTESRNLGSDWVDETRNLGSQWVVVARTFPELPAFSREICLILTP